MTVQQWVEAAWSAILDDAPMLASPSEYRTMMYKAFWKGEMPKARPQKGQKGAAPMPKASSGPSRSALAELQAEAQRIQAMQAEKQPSK
jgi:hypothetical protein